MLCLGDTFVCYFVYLRIVALRVLSLSDKDRTRISIIFRYKFVCLFIGREISR